MGGKECVIGSWENSDHVKQWQKYDYHLILHGIQKKKVANKFVTMSEEFLIQNGEMTWLLMAILD